MLGSRKKYSFTDKTQSKDGKLSVVLGTIVIIVLLFLVIRSIMAKGQLGQVYGMIGAIDCLVAFYGFMMALFGFREEDTMKSLCVAGLLMNAVPLIILVCLFVVGIC